MPMSHQRRLPLHRRVPAMAATAVLLVCAGRAAAEDQPKWPEVDGGVLLPKPVPDKAEDQWNTWTKPPESGTQKPRTGFDVDPHAAPARVQPLTPAAAAANAATRIPDPLAAALRERDRFRSEADSLRGERNALLVLALALGAGVWWLATRQAKPKTLPASALLPSRSASSSTAPAPAKPLWTKK